MFHRSSPTLFQFPFLKKFIAACQKVESVPHYQPDVTDQEFDSFFNATCRQSLLIRRVFEKKENPGVVYHLIRYRSEDDGSGCPAWYYDSSLVLLVNKKGNYSFHNYQDAENGNFSNSLPDLTIDKFLYRSWQSHPGKKPKAQPYIKNLSDSHRTDVKKLKM